MGSERQQAPSRSQLFTIVVRIMCSSQGSSGGQGGDGGRGQGGDGGRGGQGVGGRGRQGGSGGRRSQRGRGKGVSGTQQHALNALMQLCQVVCDSGLFLSVKAACVPKQVDGRSELPRVLLFRGVWAAGGRRVFVKVPRSRGECEHEARLLRHMAGRAPVAEVVATVEVGDKLALVTPLYDPLQTPSLDEWWLAEQLLEALAKVHGCGVIHCDLKPVHLMVERRASGERRLVLIDFGLAEMPTAPQRPSGWRGTRGFMAPEVNEGVEFDEKADIFSAGVTLERMATSRALVPLIEAMTLRDSALRPTALEALKLLMQVKPTGPLVPGAAFSTAAVGEGRAQLGSRLAAVMNAGARSTDSDE